MMRHLFKEGTMSCLKCGLYIPLSNKHLVEIRVQGVYLRHVITIDTSKFNKINAFCVISNSDWKMRELLK